MNLSIVITKIDKYYNLESLSELRKILSKYDELCNFPSDYFDVKLCNFPRKKKLSIDMALAYLFYLKYCEYYQIKIKDFENFDDQHLNHLREAIEIINKIIEGKNKQKFFLSFMAFLENKKPYITGSGATKETKERLFIFQQVTGILPIKYKKLEKSEKLEKLKKSTKIRKIRKIQKLEKSEKIQKSNIFLTMLERVKNGEFDIDYQFKQICKTIYFDDNSKLNGW